MNEQILRLARENAPCFIYSRDMLARQAALLHDTFPGFDILFSVKANPFPPVLRALAALGIGADAASAREVLLAEECGMDAADIYFSAAGKSDSALRAVWERGHLIADSIGEAVRIGRIAAERGEVRPIGVRIDPCFNMDGGPGGPSCVHHVQARSCVRRWRGCLSRSAASTYICAPRILTPPC